jgi:hypothetical protein
MRALCQSSVPQSDFITGSRAYRDYQARDSTSYASLDAKLGARGHLGRSISEVVENECWRRAARVRGAASSFRGKTMTNARTLGLRSRRFIAGAKHVELPGEDHVIWGSGSDGMVDQIQTFLSSVLPAATSESFLLTVLSLEIVEIPSCRTVLGDGPKI